MIQSCLHYCLFCSGTSEGAVFLWTILQPRSDVSGGGSRDDDDAPPPRDSQPSTHTAVQCLRGHRAGVTSLAFSPDALLLASGCAKGYMNVWALQDGSVLLTLSDVGIVSALAWFAEHSLAVNFSRSKDVVVAHCGSKFYHNHKVLATARRSLKEMGVVGLHQAPLLRALIQRLPILLQEQCLYEKVHVPQALLVYGVMSYPC